MRTAARVDRNQSSIVKALRKIGATVEVIKLPVDLLVGYKGRSIALEVKDKGGRLTPGQEKFFREWKGEAYIVFNEQEAISALTSPHKRGSEGK